MEPRRDDLHAAQTELAVLENADIASPQGER
jgi:hypothetical protein